MQLGRKVMGEVYKQMPVLPDSSPETQYIQQLGKRLASAIPREYSWPYEFHVIPQKDINAFALPGGPMFVNVGAIVAADNEAELVGVMAHEMSHVYMQHSAKQASKNQWASMLGALGGLFGGGVGSLARAGIQLGAGTLLMRYSRHDEAQADSVGAIIMYKAGYDPRALADFFAKLEKQGGGGGPQFLSDHPNPGNRQAAIDKEISNWPQQRYLRDSDAFLRAKQHAATLKVYSAQQIADGAKQGLWAQQNNQGGVTPANSPGTADAATGSLSSVTYQQVRPSNNMAEWSKGTFRISYPDNWRPIEDQTPALTIAPPAGTADGVIAYGVIIGSVRDSSVSSLDQATENLIRNLQQSNPDLRASGDFQNTQVGGKQGKSVILTGRSPLQQNGQAVGERDWLITASDPQGGLAYLLFIAPESEFSQLRPVYERMLNSFQFTGQ
ncbi:MAG: hypothetical protein QOD84_981 [Acidobacteriaceae bacterium]